MEMDGAGEDKPVTADPALVYTSFHCTVNGTDVEVKAEDVRQDVLVQGQTTSISSAFNVTPSDSLQLEGLQLGF